MIASFYIPIHIQLSLELLQDIVRKLGVFTRKTTWLAGEEKLELSFTGCRWNLIPAVVILLHSAAIKKGEGLGVFFGTQGT